MKRYMTCLALLTAVLLLAAVLLKWSGMAFLAPVPFWMLLVAVLYFGIAYGVQYWLTVSSVNKQPKVFIQFFLASTVAVLFVHIVVLVGGMLLNPVGGKRFAIVFLVLYVLYTVFMTVGLVRFVRDARGQ